MSDFAVIWDWGGVLMRTVDHAPRLKWDRRLNLAPGTVESVVHGSEAWRQAQRGQITLTAYWQTIGEALSLNPVDLAQLQQDFYSGDQLDRELVTLLQNLKDHGLLLGLLSNYTPDLWDILDDYALTPLFDGIVISASIGVMKPAPEAYAAVLKKLAIPPQNAIFIDDFEQNVAGARAVGMQALRFTPQTNLQSELEIWLREVMV